MPFENIPKQDTWQKLKNSNKPIVLYGMGNGADKIIAELEKRGIAYHGIFASDGFVRHQSFHDMTVMSYAEITEKFSDPIVLVCFASSRSEVLENIMRIDAERELYLPDVPVCNGVIFDTAFFSEHGAEFDRVYSLLADDASRRLYENIVYAKLSGKLSALTVAVSEDTMPYSPLSPENWRFAVDAGAYTGDTAAEMLSFAPKLEKIFAIEPDPKTYKKLLRRAESDSRIYPINAAVAEFSGTVGFDGAGGRGARRTDADAKLTVASVCVDEIAKGGCDYIKYDVEGAEAEAILGSAETIKRCKPQLLVSLYHRSEDLFTLPLLVNSIMPEYRMYLRRKSGVPAFDIELVCTAK